MEGGHFPPRQPAPPSGFRVGKAQTPSCLQLLDPGHPGISSHNPQYSPRWPDRWTEAEQRGVHLGTAAASREREDGAEAQGEGVPAAGRGPGPGTVASSSSSKAQNRTGGFIVRPQSAALPRSSGWRVAGWLTPLSLAPPRLGSPRPGPSRPAPPRPAPPCPVPSQSPQDPPGICRAQPAPLAHS